MDMFSAKNKIVLVTGGACGIGAGIVERFLLEEAKHVAFLDINDKIGKEFEARLKNNFGGDRTQFIKCDFTIEEDLLKAYDDILKEYKYIDVVVNNAGIMNDARHNYRKEIDINVKALVTSTLKAFDIMRKDEGGEGGTVINCASVVALTQGHVFPIYYATKSAVLQFSNCIGMEPHLSRTGIRVLTICFGKTETGLLDNLQAFDERTSQDIEEFLINCKKGQTPQLAVDGVMDMFKRGVGGSTWVAARDKPVRDITEKVKQAYSILTKAINDE